MAYKNERDRICYQQNSREPERHHGEMMTFEQAVGRKHDARRPRCCTYTPMKPFELWQALGPSGRFMLLEGPSMHVTPSM